MYNHNIGLDISNTGIRVGIYKDGNAKMVTYISSVVYFDDSEIVVGEGALIRACRHPENGIYDLIKLIKSNKNTLKDSKENWPFKIDFDKDGKCLIKVKREKECCVYYVQEILAYVIKEVIEKTKKCSHILIGEVIATVPDHLNKQQRKCIKQACDIAGISSVRVISKSTAAIIANNLKTSHLIDGSILIINMGKAMLEISVLNVASGNYTFVASKFNYSVSGDLIDDLLIKHVDETFKGKHTASKTVGYMEELRFECRRVKKLLDTSEHSNVLIDKNRVKVTRTALNTLCKDLYASITTMINEVLSQADLNKSQLSKVLLIGGSTNASEIKKIIKEYFNSIEVIQDFNSNEWSVKGATICAIESLSVNETLIEKEETNTLILSDEKMDHAKHSFDINIFKSNDFKKAINLKMDIYYCLRNVVDAIVNKSSRLNFEHPSYLNTNLQINKTMCWTKEIHTVLTYREVLAKREHIKKLVLDILNKPDIFGTSYFPDVDEESLLF
uniref:Heat shock protein 110 n=1 Tax=Rhabditophanes sp. KR3021 TaxID=114890 RepID=A0AC35UFU3_9BILA